MLQNSNAPNCQPLDFTTYRSWQMEPLTVLYTEIIYNNVLWKQKSYRHRTQKAFPVKSDTHCPDTKCLSEFGWITCEDHMCGSQGPGITLEEHS